MPLRAVQSQQDHRGQEHLMPFDSWYDIAFGAVFLWGWATHVYEPILEEWRCVVIE